MTFLTKSRYKETFCSPSPSQMKKGGGGKKSHDSHKGYLYRSFELRN